MHSNQTPRRSALGSRSSAALSGFCWVLFSLHAWGSSVNQSSPEIGHEDNRSLQSYARRVMERTAEECRRSFRVWPHNFRSTSSSS